MEIIEIGKDCCDLSVEESCRVLELNPRSYYRWKSGETGSGAGDRHGGGGGHNRLRPEEITVVVEYAKRNPQLHPRRIAYELEQKKILFIGKSKVAEIMKANGLHHAFDPRKKRVEIPPEDMLRSEPHRKNLVWGLDWTWVRVGTRFMFLLVVIDWYSRRIVAWSFHMTITRFEVVAVVTEAVATEEIDLLPEGALRPMVVADHGSANTAPYTAKNLDVLGLDLWLSGVGRPTGNARTERVMGTLRREELSFQEAYKDEPEAYRRISATITDYNGARPNAGNGGFAPNLVHAFGRHRLTEEREANRRLTERQRRDFWNGQQTELTPSGVVS
jgi:putative transposase